MSVTQTSWELARVYDLSRVYNGYTMYSPWSQKDVWLINMKGQFVDHWRLPRVLGEMGVLLPNGNMMCGVRIPGGPVEYLPGQGEQLLEMDWEGNIVWKYDDPYMNSHEQCRMENRNTMITRWTPIPRDLAARVKGGIPGNERNGTMWGDVLQEISPEGKVVWECPVYELLDPDIDILCPLCPREQWTYINSLVVLPDGDILVSLRLINTIAIIDKDRREIKWRWGRHELGHQHNPTLLDNGNVLALITDCIDRYLVQWGLRITPGCSR